MLFWHRPKMMTEMAWVRVRAKLCPKARATTTAKSPEIANRMASAVRGGAWATITRPVAKAEDHRATKTSPIKMLRADIALSDKKKGPPEGQPQKIPTR